MDFLYTIISSPSNAYTNLDGSAATVHKLMSHQTMAEHLVGRLQLIFENIPKIVVSLKNIYYQ